MKERLEYVPMIGHAGPVTNVNWDPSSTLDTYNDRIRTFRRRESINESLSLRPKMQNCGVEKGLVHNSNTYGIE